MDDIEFEELSADDIVPLDVAAGLLAQGFILETIETYQPMFDPYFND